MMKYEFIKLVVNFAKILEYLILSLVYYNGTVTCNKILYILP